MRAATIQINLTASFQEKLVSFLIKWFIVTQFLWLDIVNDET